jgi:hypothetical protein
MAFSTKIVILVNYKDHSLYEAFQKAFAGFEPVVVRHLKQNEYVPCVPELDAIWLTPPYAEKWGSKPLLHQAQILTTGTEEQESGIPRFIVAGVSTTADEAKDPLRQLQLTLRTILETIEHFNMGSTRPIRNLGVWSFYFRNLDPTEVANLVKEVHEGGGR